MRPESRRQTAVDPGFHPDDPEPGLLDASHAKGSLPYRLATLLLVSFTWFLLTGDNWASWLIGVPAVLFAAWSILHLRKTSQGRISLVGLLRFLPYFVWESVLGGVDVAIRVIQPRMRIAPGFITYRMNLSEPSAQRLFVNSLSLLPGTLAADLQGEQLHIHALDCHAELEPDLHRLESRVRAVYGEAS